MPRLSLSREYPVNRCSQTYITEVLELHGTEIPAFIKKAAREGRAIRWELRGTWKGMIYGQDATISEAELSWTGIPNWKEETIEII